MASNGFVWEEDTLTPGLAKFAPEVDRRVSEATELFAPQTEASGKANAPWTDQTGNARQTLNAHAFHVPLSLHGIEFAHGMPYGIWLEVRFEGKYAIILKTLKVMGNQLMEALRGMFARSGGFV